MAENVCTKSVYRHDDVSMKSLLLLGLDVVATV